VQLDIFNDSRDVMLRNDVLHALQSRDAARVGMAICRLQRDYPQDPLLADACVLQRAMQARPQPCGAGGGFADHADLRHQRLALLQAVLPAVQRWMDTACAQTWLRPLWHELITRAGSLPFRADAEQDHAAWMLLQAQSWQASAEAVEQIESWRRIPAPLSWMAQAKLHLNGLRATWPLLVELAWLAPHRFAALAAAAPASQLNRLMDQFESAWDDLESAETSQIATHKIAESGYLTGAWAWFPAWVLIAAPQHAADLALAQPGQYTPPEQAMRLLVNLLGLERQGRHSELIRRRKTLRDLHAGLYAVYMSTR